MGWIPDEPEDALWFLLAPITTFPTLVYGAAGYVTGDYPYGKPDWRANVRNSILWLGAAGAAYSWNYFMSPQNAVWMSGQTAYKTAFHLVPPAAAAPVGLLAATLAAGIYVHSSPAPTEAHRSEPGETSWWRAVAQAMTGTGFGVGSGITF